MDDYLQSLGYERKNLQVTDTSWSAYYVRTTMDADTANGDTIHIERGTQ